MTNVEKLLSAYAMIGAGNILGVTISKEFDAELSKDLTGLFTPVAPIDGGVKYLGYGVRVTVEA